MCEPLVGVVAFAKIVDQAPACLTDAKFRTRHPKGVIMQYLARSICVSGMLVLAVAVGCTRAIDDASSAAAESAPSAAAAVAVETKTDLLPADDPAWEGLERREIQLDQKLLVVKGPKGVIGCPYLDVNAFEKFGEACAIIPAVDTAGMLKSKVTAATTKAKELGIEVGMPGREALDKIR